MVPSVKYGMVGVYTFPSFLQPSVATKSVEGSSAPAGVPTTLVDLDVEVPDKVSQGASLPQVSGAVPPGASLPQVSGAEVQGASLPQVSGAEVEGASLPQVSGAVPPGASLPQVSGAEVQGASLPQVSGAEVEGASLPQVSGAVPPGASLPQVSAGAEVQGASLPQVSGAEVEGASLPQVSGAVPPGASLPQVSGAEVQGASLPQVPGAKASGASLPQISGAVPPGASLPQVSGAEVQGASLPQVSGAVASGASLPQVSGTSLSQSSGAVVSGASLPQLPNAMPTDVAVSSTVGGPAAEPLTDPFKLNLPDLFGGEEPLEAGDSLVHSGPPIDEPDVVASPVAVSPQEEQASSESNVKWDQQWRDQPFRSVPMVEIPFFVALPSKHAAAATEAVMQVMTALRALGLPVARLHSDRGGEFVNRSLRLFCLQHCIERTTTAGDNALDFRQNGRCENMVRRLKRQARTLLQAYQAPVELWAFAMRHSAARLRAYALSLLGLPQPALLPWYTQVVLRTRTWNSDQWSSRALKGRVIAPSGDVHHGHLVLCSDGQFLHSDSLVEWVHTGPHPMHVAEHLLPPTRRYRRKTPPDLSVAAPEDARQGGAGEVSAASAAGVSKFAAGEVSAASAAGVSKFAGLGKQKTVRFEVPEGEGPGEFTPYRSDPSGPRSQDEVRANLLLQQVGPIETRFKAWWMESPCQPFIDGTSV